MTDRLDICIVDDEPLARRRMCQLLAQTNGLDIVAQVGNGEEALEVVANQQPDILLLDVEMPRMDGFDVIEALELSKGSRDVPLIIFVTAFPDFAPLAFDKGAIDFLTKPVRLSRLLTALERAREAHAMREAVKRLEYLQHELEEMRVQREEIAFEEPIWISSNGEMVRLIPSQITRVSAEGEYVQLYVGQDTYLYRRLISRFLDDLNDPDMVRLHRSHAVRMSEISRISRNQWGAPVLRMVDGVEIPIGRKYYEEFKTRANL